MLVLNILSGPQTGKSFPLKEGVNVLGRTSEADITIASSQVSKKHAEIRVEGNNVELKDLGSRNGTFVNGVQIKQQRVTVKDRITLHDIVVMIGDERTNAFVPKTKNIPMPSYGNAAIDQNRFNELGFESPAASEPNNEVKAEVQNDIKGKALNYLDEVVLPGVYKLTEWFEFKWVLGGFLGALILLITILSTLPAISLLKSSIQKESQRRALTIAKNLVEVNKASLAQGLYSSIDLGSAANEAGVIQAIIISSDGSIIAPSSKAGEHPDIPFLHTARQEGKTQVQQISTNEIGAIVPVSVYNSNTGSQKITAYSFILYDMGSLAIDDGRTMSLYIQVLFISLIVGGILMFFIFKLFSYPFSNINSQLNEELKSPSGNIKLDFNFDITQKLISNINSALSRTQSDNLNIVSSSTYDRSAEINNLIQVIGFPAIAILNSDQSISAVNSAAEEILGLNHEVIGQNIELLNDQALKLSIKDLVDQSMLNPSQIINNDLEISGVNYDLMALAIYGKDEVSYYVVSFIPREDSE